MANPEKEKLKWKVSQMQEAIIFLFCVTLIFVMGLILFFYFHMTGKINIKRSDGTTDFWIYLIIYSAFFLFCFLFIKDLVSGVKYYWEEKSRLAKMSD